MLSTNKVWSRLTSVIFEATTQDPMDLSTLIMHPSFVLGPKHGPRSRSGNWVQFWAQLYTSRTWPITASERLRNGIGGPPKWTFCFLVFWTYLREVLFQMLMNSTSELDQEFLFCFLISSLTHYTKLLMTKN